MALTCGDNGSTGSEVITQINKNETDIASNVTEIASLGSRVTALESLEDYADATGQDITDIPDSFTTIAEFNTPLSSGRYVIGFSITYKYTNTSHSTLIKLTIDGFERNYSIEAKDVTDNVPQAYYLPYNWNGGSLNVKLEVAKEAGAGGTLDVLYGNIIADKKKEL